MVEFVGVDNDVGLADLVPFESEVGEGYDLAVYGEDDRLGAVDCLEMHLVIRGAEAGEADKEFGDALTAVYRFGGGEDFATAV